jgi:hypothetical protein
MADSELDRNEIADNKGAYFRLPPAAKLGKGGYSLALSLVDYTGPKRLTVWATGAQKNTGNYLEINGEKSDLSLKWRIVEFRERDSILHSKRWKRIDLEPDILVLENMQVTNSAYFVRDLEASNQRIDFSGLAVRQPSSGVIEIDYSGEEAGWIVLPMRLHPGWKASIQGRPVRHDTYLDILPAIPVKGASKVLFRYEPAAFRIGAIASSIGMVVFSIFGILCARYKEAI